MLTPHLDSEVRVRSALPADHQMPTDLLPGVVNSPVMTTSSRMLSPSEEIAATDVVAARGLCAREEANPDHWLPSIVDRPPNEGRLRRARARADRQCRVGAESGNAQCPARTACLLLAVGRGEKHGIWGGLIPADLTALAKDADQVEALLNDYRAGDAAPGEAASEAAGSEVAGSGVTGSDESGSTSA